MNNELSQKVDELNALVEKQQKQINQLIDIQLHHKHRQFDESALLDGVAPALAYGGIVLSDGTAGSLPPGWTSSRLATGEYQVNHTLGTADFVVVITAANGSFGIGEVDSWDEDQFTIQFDNLSLIGLNLDFHFILLPI